MRLEIAQVELLRRCERRARRYNGLGLAGERAQPGEMAEDADFRTRGRCVLDLLGGSAQDARGAVTLSACPERPAQERADLGCGSRVAGRLQLRANALERADGFLT